MAEVDGLFLQRSPDKVRAIRKAAEKGDARALQMAAHSFKSSSACIGAMRLSALAKKLEMTGRSGTLERSRAGAEELREEFHLAVKAASRDSQLRPAAEAR